MLFGLLVGYLLARATLGALVNPAFNGPDEGGHWEYIESWTASGGRAVTGVERQQPALYYAIASWPFRWTAGAPVEERLFAVRLLSVGSGIVTAGAAWLAARRLWPGRRQAALLTAAVATLAPGHLFLLASVNNDPLATALASVAVLAAIHLYLWPPETSRTPGVEQRPTWDVGRETWDLRLWWWVVFAVAGALAVGTKLTALPVLLGSAGALGWRYRRGIVAVVGRRALLLAGGLALAGLLALYIVLLGQPPSTSRWASMAHFWPLTLAVSLPGYVRGGLGESFGTFWYAYDYAVRWGGGIERVLGGLAGALLVGSALGLAWGLRGPYRGEMARQLPGVLWAGAGAQIAFVVLRFGFGTVLQIEMGGVAQAKGFFPAVVPLALLFVGGWWTLHGALRGRDARWLTLALLGTFLLLDWVSLGVTLWHHYRWLQVGL